MRGKFLTWIHGSLMALCIFVLVCTLPAYADEPLFSAQRYTALQKAAPLSLVQSQIIYGKLFYAGQTDYFRVQGKKGDLLLFELAIPRRGGLETFRPSVAVIGPGLPMVSLDTSYCVIPNGLGAHIVEPSLREREITDPMTGCDYWLTQVFQFRLPSDADYYLAVFDKEGKPGKYSLQVGVPEERSIAQGLKHPVQVLQVRAWYNPTQLLVVMAFVAMAMGLFFIGWLAKRQKK
ncbi:hypothetical protein H1S01_01270 [Heliobacterium chlorum]|uniref:Uncharacterized protein n=1 Tax=Heliobacterium chlorum TaxID=2698 RepID=A0ABR7SXF4_HELCL|nr:hypothetical protein [Heliobacterium chlorum]MBC9783136.1 hypothetical protein [Heliobacterium chlorum]